MSLWNPMAVLANVELNEPIEAQLAAFAPASDARVQDVNTAHPVHATFLDRFTDAFGNKCHPTVLIVRPSAPETIRSADALASIRDVLSASVIPRARARYTRQLGNCGVFYSSSFEFYPWMVDRNYESLVSGTPELRGLRDIDDFVGQCSAGSYRESISCSSLDKPLFNTLLSRWKIAYSDGDPSWDDEKLMRSLNMAYHASQPPANQDATVFDYGRIIALWVSALEILIHPIDGKKVTQNHLEKLLEKTIWTNSRFKEWILELWKRLYKRRHDFIHGNTIDREELHLTGARSHLFAVAAPLYRMALASYLGLTGKLPDAPLENAKLLGRQLAEKMEVEDYQKDYESAIRFAYYSSMSKT